MCKSSRSQKQKNRKRNQSTQNFIGLSMHNKTAGVAQGDQRCLKEKKEAIKEREAKIKRLAKNRKSVFFGNFKRTRNLDKEAA